MWHYQFNRQHAKSVGILLSVAVSVLVLPACVSPPAPPPAVVAAPQVPASPANREEAANTNPLPPATAPQIAPKLGVAVAKPQLLIANDLIDVLRQIDGYRPTQATLRVPAAQNAFAAALEDAMIASGYQLRRVAQRNGQGVIMSSVIPEQAAAGGPNYTYILAVDRIALKHTYRVSGNYVEPMTSLFVKGAPSSALQLNDARFLSGY